MRGGKNAKIIEQPKESIMQNNSKYIHLLLESSEGGRKILARLKNPINKTRRREETHLMGADGSAE
jgi:hypothetical protein